MANCILWLTASCVLAFLSHSLFWSDFCNVKAFKAFMVFAFIIAFSDTLFFGSWLLSFVPSIVAVVVGMLAIAEIVVPVVLFKKGRRN